MKNFKKRKIYVNAIIAFLFALGLYVKEFYLLTSGSLQIGDILLLLAFIVHVFSKKVSFQQIDGYLFMFVLIAFTINLAYYIYFVDASFMKYSLYLLFSIIIVLLTRSILYSKLALSYSLIALKATLLTQLAVKILGLGRFFFGRYSGTFNDPNQFGYYVLISVFTMYVMSFLTEKNLHLVWILVAGYLIINSQSSGMLLSFIIFFALYIWQLTGEQTNIIKYTTRFSVILLLLLSIITIFSVSSVQLSISGYGLSGLARLFNRVSSGNSIVDFFKFYLRDRSITRVIENPWVCLYGSGEGMWTRYSSNNEIHATMISLCYYYGIIPYCLWIIWLRNNMKSIHPTLLCVYVAHVIEAFTLANHRQPLFWIMFVLASSAYAKNHKNDNLYSCPP